MFLQDLANSQFLFYTIGLSFSFLRSVFTIGESMHLKIEGGLFLAHNLHEEVGVIAVELPVV